MTGAGWISGALAGLLLGAGLARADDFRWSRVAEETIAHLEQALAASKAGQVDAARQAVIAAYFGSFEDRKLEAALRKEIGQQHIAEVEAWFNALRKGVGHAAPEAELAGLVARLSETLRTDAKLLEARGVPEQVYEGR